MRVIFENIYFVTLAFQALAVLMAAIRLKYVWQSKLIAWVIFSLVGTVVYEVAYQYFITLFDEPMVRLVGNNILVFIELYCVLYLFSTVNPIQLSPRWFYGLLVLLSVLFLFESFSVNRFGISHQFVLAGTPIGDILVTLVSIFCSIKVLIEMYRNDYYYTQIPYFWLSAGIFLNYTFSLITLFPDKFIGSSTLRLAFFATYCFFVIIANIIFAYAFWLTKSWIKRGGSTLKY